MGGYEECEDSSHSLYPCYFFRIFLFWFFQASIEHLLSVINLSNQYPSHMRSTFFIKKKFKEVEIQEGTKNMRILHFLHILTNFIVFFDFDFFQASIEHPLSIINLFNQYPSNMRSKKVFKSSRKWRFNPLTFFVSSLTFFVPSKFYNFLNFFST